MRIATPALFCFPFAWNIYFPSSHFQSICVFRSEVGFLYIAYILVFIFFCIHSASLCLFVGAFNPFTFDVITDIYVPIAIFLIVWGWFCRSFSSLVFLGSISPFNICCIADWFQIGQGVCQGCILSLCYLTYMQNTSWETPGWKKYRLESRLLGEISITSDMQMTPPLYGRKWRGTEEPLDESERGEWNR